MTPERVTLLEGVSIYKELSKRWLWKNLTHQQKESLDSYWSGDFLVITKERIYIEKQNWIKKIKTNTKHQLSKQKETISRNKYNDHLMWTNKLLSPDAIKSVLNKYSQREWRIETLINSWKIPNYLVQKIGPQINTSWNWYLVYVDTELQRSFLVNFNDWNLSIVWYVKISTWDETRNPKKKIPWKDRYWNTPHVIIPMKKWFWKSNPDKWKTYSGFWKRWSRVFSLENYSLKNHLSIANDKNIDLSLAMHKTSPEGEKNLWKKMSHWCIRTERIMIDLLQNIERQNLFRYTIIWDYKKNQSPIIAK